MAFRSKNMSVIAYANGFTLWHYATNDDSFTDICSIGYFNDMITLVNTGDIVIINAENDTGMRKISIENGTVLLEPLN